MADTPDVTAPAPEELRQLLDIHHPASVLGRLTVAAGLPDPLPVELVVCQAEALIDLDRSAAALDLLNAHADRLQAVTSLTVQAQGLNLQALILNRAGWHDAAVLLALQAAGAAQDDDSRALALVNAAAGYACKNCWGLSDQYLRDALELSPTNPRVLAAQARIRLEADQRLEARSVYERLAELPAPWARPVALWGLAYTAYLLGEFGLAENQARAALMLSNEYVPAIFTLAQVALVRGDLPGLHQAIAELQARSPQAESLAWYQHEASLLEARLGEPRSGRRFRLAAFPTLVQRRNYCGPSTVELVLRYWQGSPEFSNDRIAERVKYPRGGTPIFRMREFFSLAGFSAVRCQAPVSLLKQALTAGFPVIVQLEYSNTSHVVVAIGYDDVAGTIELQDPMTHAVTAAPLAEFNQRRQLFQDSAVIAFPQGRGLENELARLNIFEDRALVWADQSVLELEQERYSAAANLADQALKRHRALPFAWLVRLHAALERWRAAHEGRLDETDPEARRAEFFKLLNRAQSQLRSNQELINHFEGWAALLDRDYPRALAAFQAASQADPDDAANYAFLAECLFALRDTAGAFEAARHSLEIDSSLLAGNIWMARCSAAHSQAEALHYARSALDLAPSNWLTHYTLAEAAIRAGNLDLAGVENDQALNLGQTQVQPVLQRGLLLALQHDFQAAGQVLKSILEAQHTLCPADEFTLLQLMAQIALQQKKLASALAQVERMLALFPDDPWCVHFQAVTQAHTLAERQSRSARPGRANGHSQASAGLVSPDEITALQGLFEHAMALNPGNPQVLVDYLQALESLNGPQAALAVLSTLQQADPLNGRLAFLQARLLAQTEDLPQAVEAMLAALARPDGVLNPDELTEAVLLIFQVLGPHRGVERILALPLVDDGIPHAEVCRILGLVLAEMGPEEAELANSLLRQALEQNPDDAPLTLALGKVSASEEDREALFRRALLLEPGWLPARANLANYLLSRSRPGDALSYTRGYESQDLDLLLAHSRALQQSGLYEEAADCFEKVFEMVEEPDSDLYFGLWQAQLHSGWGDRSYKTARKALQLFPTEPRWYLCAAESLRSLERFDEAERMVRRGRSHGLSQADMLRAAYENAYARREYPAALQRIDDYLQLCPEQRGDGRLGWAESARLRLLMEMGYLDDALDFLDHENLSAAGWGEAALIASHANQPALGLEFAGHALHLDSQNYAGLFTRAQALADLGRENEAVNALYALLDAYPEEHHAYENLALRLALDGQMEQALQYAERSVALGSFCPFAWAALGVVYYLNGQPEDALQDLQTAYTRADAQSRQKHPEYWYLLVRLQGKSEEAERLRSSLEAKDLTPFRIALLERF